MLPPRHDCRRYAPIAAYKLDGQESPRSARLLQGRCFPLRIVRSQFWRKPTDCLYEHHLDDRWLFHGTNGLPPEWHHAWRGVWLSLSVLDKKPHGCCQVFHYSLWLERRNVWIPVRESIFPMAFRLLPGVTNVRSSDKSHGNNQFDRAMPYIDTRSSYKHSQSVAPLPESAKAMLEE